MTFVFSKYYAKNNLPCNLLKDLIKLKSKREDYDIFLSEVQSILRRSMISNKSALYHLDSYQQKEYLLDDNKIDAENIYTLGEIEKICELYRMCFLDIHYFKKEIPTIAEIKIEYLNDTYNKKIDTRLKILSYRECFTNPYTSKNYAILFAPTLNGHYYLIHQWGKGVPKIRKYLCYPLRTFETLALSLIIFTLIVDLILPTNLITLDRTATYWCGYRLGVFFHLLIFFGGFTVFIVMAFFKNLSKNIWNVP